MAGPPLVKRNDRFMPNTGDDPAAMLVRPTKFRRPQLISGDRTYTWPIGIEGFRVSGRATLGIHHPIGRNVVAVSMIHLDEGRLTLEGEFAGLTAVENMVQLRDVCMAFPPANGKILILPGVFEEIQYVMVEEHDFVHDAGDFTHSIAYTLSMIRIGSKGDADEFANMDPPPQPGNNSTPRGDEAGKKLTGGSVITQYGVSVFLTSESTATFREIAQRFLGSADKWTTILNLNKQPGGGAPGGGAIPSHMLPTFRWPIGTGIIIKKK